MTSVEEAWEILQAAGVPTGAIRAAPREPVAWDRVAAALRLVIDSGPSPDARRDALVSWIGALRRHWPSRLRAILDGDPEQTFRALADGVDANRYLKLRRIALANLTGIA